MSRVLGRLWASNCPCPLSEEAAAKFFRQVGLLQVPSYCRLNRCVHVFPPTPQFLRAFFFPLMLESYGMSRVSGAHSSVRLFLRGADRLLHRRYFFHQIRGLFKTRLLSHHRDASQRPSVKKLMQGRQSSAPPPTTPARSPGNAPQLEFCAFPP